MREGKFNEGKLNEGNFLNDAERRLLCGIGAILEVLKAEGFEETDFVAQKISTLLKWPGGGVHLDDIFTVLCDAIKKEHACITKYLSSLLGMLNESIADAKMEAKKEALLMFFPSVTSKQPTGERERKALAERSWAMHPNVNKT
ncbi:MAG: hypothetical protein FWG75_10305 [Cystobacterineae bacterium]|nr:hypothetical protein [Cystobacterineae bacterium]